MGQTRKDDWSKGLDFPMSLRYNYLYNYLYKSIKRLHIFIIKGTLNLGISLLGVCLPSSLFTMYLSPSYDQALIVNSSYQSVTPTCSDFITRYICLYRIYCSMLKEKVKLYLKQINLVEMGHLKPTGVPKN